MIKLLRRRKKDEKKIVYKNNVYEVSVHDSDKGTSVLIGLLAVIMMFTAVALLLVTFVFERNGNMINFIIIVITSTLSAVLFVYIILIKKKFKYLNLTANVLFIVRSGSNIHLVPKRADVFGNVKIKTPAGEFFVKLPANAKTGKFAGMDVYVLDLERAVVIGTDGLKELAEVTEDAELKEIVNTYFYLRDRFEELKAEYKESIEKGESEERIKQLEETLKQVQDALTQIEKTYKIAKLDKDSIILLSDEESVLEKFKHAPVLKFINFERIYDVLPLSYITDQLAVLRMMVEKEKKGTDARTILIIAFAVFLVLIAVAVFYMLTHSRQEIILNLPQNLTQYPITPAANTSQNVTIIKLP